MAIFNLIFQLTWQGTSSIVMVSDIHWSSDLRVLIDTHTLYPNCKYLKRYVYSCVSVCAPLYTGALILQCLWRPVEGSGSPPHPKLESPCRWGKPCSSGKSTTSSARYFHGNNSRGAFRSWPNWGSEKLLSCPRKSRKEGQTWAVNMNVYNSSIFCTVTSCCDSVE